MSTCRDCIYFKVGNTRYYGEKSACDDVQERCKYFKDKSLFVELPCKINDVVYCIATVNDALHPTFSWGCCEKYRIVKCTCKSIDVKLSDYVEYTQIYCTDKTEDHKGTDFHFLLKPEDFGTEAFLTKEEAEQKLYDMPEVKCGECTVCDGSVYSMCFRKEDEGK